MQTRRQGRWQGWQRGQRDDFTLSEARHAILERRAVVAGCTLLFLAVAMLYALSREPVYTAEATLAIRSEEGIGAAENFEEVLSGLQDSAAMSGQVEEAAGPPERRYDTQVFLVVIAAAGGGLLVGAVGALFLESRTRRWSGSRDAELTLRAPVLGVIPYYSDEHTFRDEDPR